VAPSLAAHITRSGRAGRTQRALLGLLLVVLPVWVGEGEDVEMAELRAAEVSAMVKLLP